MNEVPVAPLTAKILEPRPLQVADQFSDFAGHCDTSTLSHGSRSLIVNYADCRAGAASSCFRSNRRVTTAGVSVIRRALRSLVK